MNIPKKFSIAGGKIINVYNLDTINDGDTYGDYSDVKGEIRLAEKINVGDNEFVDISDEDRERSFYHELFHCMQYLYNCEYSESMAQTFSNFMYEFMHTKQ